MVAPVEGFNFSALPVVSSDTQMEFVEGSKRTSVGLVLAPVEKVAMLVVARLTLADAPLPVTAVEEYVPALKSVSLVCVVDDATLDKETVEAAVTFDAE